MNPAKAPRAAAAALLMICSATVCPIADRASKRAPRECRKDLLGAGELFGFRGGGRLAHENTLAARCRRQTGWIEWTEYLDAADAGDAIFTAAGHEWEQGVVGLSEAPGDKRHSDFVRAGFDVDRNVLKAAVDGLIGLPMRIAGIRGSRKRSACICAGSIQGGAEATHTSARHGAVAASC